MHQASAAAPELRRRRKAGLGARRLPISRNAEENQTLDSDVGHGAERLDLPQAIIIRSMRSGDERPAHLGTVPARFDSEAGSFCGVNVTRGEMCHRSFLLYERITFRCVLAARRGRSLCRE